MSDTTANIELTTACPATRWIQLGLGVICMMAISSPGNTSGRCSPSRSVARSG